MAGEPRKPMIRGRRIIERPRLNRVLDRSDARVRMLVAGPGFGKTTLTEQWAPAGGRVLGWYRARRSAADVAVAARGLVVSGGHSARGRGTQASRAAGGHGGPRARGDAPRRDAGRGPRRLARARLDRDRRLPASRRVGGLRVLRGDDRRALAGAAPRRRQGAALLGAAARASSTETYSRYPKALSR